MATGLDHGANGRDEDKNAPLGYDENISTGDSGRKSTAKGPEVAGSLMPTIQALQASMASVANGMQKMGDAWAALAANKTPQATNQMASPIVPSTSSTKRTFEDMEAEDKADLDYDDDVDDDDHDDVASLMKKVSGTCSDTTPTGEASDNNSLLDTISAKYNEEDDVGPEAHAKLAFIANKAFTYSGTQSVNADMIKRKQDPFCKAK